MGVSEARAELAEPDREKTGVGLVGTVFNGYVVVDSEIIHIDPTRILVSPSVSLNRKAQIAINVVLGRKARRMSGNTHRVFIHPYLQIEGGRLDEESARAAYKKVVSDLRDPKRNFRLLNPLPSGRKRYTGRKY